MQPVQSAIRGEFTGPDVWSYEVNITERGKLNNGIELTHNVAQSV